MGLRIRLLWKLASSLTVDCHTSLCLYGHRKRTQTQIVTITITEIIISITITIIIIIIIIIIMIMIMMIITTTTMFTNYKPYWTEKSWDNETIQWINAILCSLLDKNAVHFLTAVIMKLRSSTNLFSTKHIFTFNWLVMPSYNPTYQTTMR